MTRLPLPVATDDLNRWVEGRCWLRWCGNWYSTTRVTWIGPASVAGASAPIFACEPWIRLLGGEVLREVMPPGEVRPDFVNPYAHELRRYTVAGPVDERRVAFPAPEVSRQGHGP
jgi:hypothetical protein